ncbi:THUMP domain-containing class I SAM-dependent RNA methyltransferase [Eubacterium ruminantium]|uniref:Putative N6-adenine-specific DNA methylase n=1 Tax=Eubacterium ruminantium TaxID=42322 RepID=A0A1T4KMC2_9FIRM|nr:class I SAM-dependent RNA methyltransferase [Eubacterium ruminantium]SCW33341.1 putative N6-adenine-specific DNA methylase [Eubacterium ruminantium]SDM30501.1 putative N6-adenine-specific DNA methylase [Eubacterium ruminantium]SJZ43539.1 putative N6-adenine-specific DNA methylase [Eubacterium ruminantium]
MNDEKFTLIAPCHFGLESVLKREIQDLGYNIINVSDGRVTFEGDSKAIARANIFIRTAERILLKCGSFRATTFDDLFEGVKDIPWERYLPRNAKFWVTKATTNRSALFSASAIQSIVKKAMVDRMSKTYHTSHFDEDGDEYPVRIFILKDEVEVTLDTTGVSLHKRGYRKLVGKAPISETLAAALIMLTPWRSDRILVDPFCGSGTFPIEAAMIGANIAPGLNREFTSDKWLKFMTKKEWYEAYDEAASLEKTDIEMNIQGYDLDSEMVKCAIQNAKEAGVDKYIHFQARNVRDLRNPKPYGFLITNPPYGERLEEKEALPELYNMIGESYRGLKDWSMFIITSYEDAERYLGRKADKNRKIYNGMIKSYFLSYMGAKPPKRKPTNGE